MFARPGLSTVQNLLDANYRAEARRVIAALTGIGAPGTLLARRLDELDAEAARLAEQGERLRPDNPVVRQVLTDLGRVLAQERRALRDASSGVVSRALEAAARTSRELLLMPKHMEIAWNRVDPEAVRAYLGYTDSEAFRDVFANFPDEVVADTRRAILADFARGKGPLAAARALRERATGMPAHRANALLRTLHVQSWRDASAVHLKANEDILDHQVRIETLDKRVCLACLALHGKQMPAGERINGHYNCRGTVIGVVKGFPRSVRTGEEWLTSLPPDRQRQLMGSAAYDAWKAGAVRLDDFVGQHTDKLFGKQVAERSLKDILGPARARTFYPHLRPSGYMEPDKWATHADAERWLKAKYPHVRFTGDVKAADLDNLRESMTELDRLGTAWPEVMNRLQRVHFFDDPQSNALARAHRDGKQIEYNLHYFKQRTGPPTPYDKQNRWSFGTSVSGGLNWAMITTHEFGHQVDNWLQASLSYYRTLTEYAHPSQVVSLRAVYDDFFKYNKPTVSLSRYSVTNRAENFAEAFAALHHLPPSEWPVYVKRFAALLETVTRSTTYEYKNAYGLKWLTDLPSDSREREAAKAEFLRVYNDVRKRLNLKGWIDL